MTEKSNSNFWSPLGQTFKIMGKLIESAGETFEKIGKSKPYEADSKNIGLFPALNKLVKSANLIDEMTYEDAIKYFVNQRPSDSRVKKAAMLKESHSKGQLITQIFLDTNNELVCRSNGEPYGRKLIVKRLDDELTEAFAGKNLIIFE